MQRLSAYYSALINSHNVGAGLCSDSVTAMTAGLVLITTDHRSGYKHTHTGLTHCGTLTQTDRRHLGLSLRTTASHLLTRLQPEPRLWDVSSGSAAPGQTAGRLCGG